jgi:hypothetical protein
MSVQGRAGAVQEKAGHERPLQQHRVVTIRALQIKRALPVDRRMNGKSAEGR